MFVVNFHDGNLMSMASILSEKGLVQPEEQVEFLAKRLLYRESIDKRIADHVLLTTPLYIVLSDEPHF
jgi:hypothetical protein